MPKEKNNNNLQKKPINQVYINNNEYEEEYEFIQVNAATGDQYRKFGKIRSEGGQITSEMVNKFHDESTKEARQWQLNNSGVRTVAFRDTRDEDGKQVIKLLPTGDLIFPSEQRVKVYDENGNQIIGEENIRKEIEKRTAEWEQWEKEGKLQVVDHRTHEFDDGSTATVYFRIPPVKRLHENELNNIVSNFEQVGKRLRGIEKQQESKEYDYSNSQIRGKIVEMDVDQPETSPSKGQESPPTETKTSPKLPSEGEIKKLSKDELISLNERLSEELKSRDKGETGSSSDFRQFSTSELKEAKSKSENALNSFKTSNTTTPGGDDKSSKVGGVLAVVGVVSAFAISSVVFLKNKLGKSKKK